MSLPGSIASMTARAGSRGERHLHDDAGDQRIVVELADRRRTDASVASPSISTSRRRCRPWRSRAGSARGRPSRRVPPDDDHGKPGRAAVRGGECRDVLGDRGADLVGDRRALEQPRAGDVPSIRRAPAPGEARAARRCRPPRASRRPGARSRGAALDAGRHRLLELRVADRWQVDQDVGRGTCAAASPRSEATSRSLEALTLLRPARPRPRPISSTQASTQTSGTSVACARRGPERRGHARRAPRRCRAGASWRPRTPRRRRRPRPRAPGTGPPGAGPSRWPRPGGRRVAAYSRAARRQRRDHRDEAAPRLPATADALPPPGTGAAEASSATNASSVRSRNRVRRRPSPRLYGRACGSATGRPIRMGRARPAGRAHRASAARGVSDTGAADPAPAAASPSRTSVPGRARYRRARPETRLADGGGRDAAGGPTRRDPSPRASMLGSRSGGRRRTSSSRPVTVQRRERCW